MTQKQYTQEHEWIHIDGDMATIGITTYARHALGDLVYLELPAKDRHLQKGESFAVVESVKAASEIYSPVSGTIVAVNESLLNNLDALKEDLSLGWIVRIRIDTPANTKDLMDEDAYQEYIKRLS